MALISNFRSPDPSTSPQPPGPGPSSVPGQPVPGQQPVPGPPPGSVPPPGADPTSVADLLASFDQLLGFDPAQLLGRQVGAGQPGPAGQPNVGRSGVGQANKAGVASPATGSGTIAGASTAPDPSAPGTTNAMMASISTLMPRLTGEQLDTLITSMTTKLKDTIDKSDKDQIKTQQGEKRAQLAEKAKKQEEAAKKLEELQAKMHGGNIFDKLKLAALYLGAIAAIIAGVALIALSPLLAETVVGTALCIVAGVMLISAGALLLTAAVDSTVQTATAEGGQPGEGMFTRGMKAMAQLCGADDDTANKVGQYGGMAIELTLMVAACALMIGASIVQPELGEFAVMDAIEAVNTGMDLATTSVAVTGDVGSSVENYQAADIQSDAKKMQADAKKMEALGKVLDDFIDMAIARLKGNNDRFNATLDTITDAMQDQAASMSRAQFRA